MNKPIFDFSNFSGVTKRQECKVLRIINVGVLSRGKVMGLTL